MALEKEEDRGCLDRYGRTLWPRHLGSERSSELEIRLGGLAPKRPCSEIAVSSNRQLNVLISECVLWPNTSSIVREQDAVFVPRGF